MAAISETLRQARLRSGVDLDRLAAKTKINPRYLQAIETGDFDKLPSGIFARMFIKQYADAVGLDGASFAEEFQRSSEFGHSSAPDIGAIVETQTNFHPSVPSFASSGDSGRSDRVTSMLSSLIWVVAAILVCAAAYYLLAHLPSRAVVAVAPSSNKPSLDNQAPPDSKPPVAQPPQAPAPQTANDIPATPPATPATPQVTPPAPAAPASPIQLTLTATESVWVTAKADGQTVFSELLPAGASRTVAATQGARITLGNAAGVDITFNGKKLEPFGTRGQVRSVDFTSWGAQVVSRTLPNPEALPDPLR